VPEYELARRIVENTLTPAIEFLSSMASSSTTYVRASAVQHIARLRSILRGAAPIMRPAALPHTPPFSPESRDHRGWCATISPVIIVSNCPPQLLLVCKTLVSNNRNINFQTDFSTRSYGQCCTQVV
jgi:hypothetical protein